MEFRMNACTCNEAAVAVQEEKETDLLLEELTPIINLKIVQRAEKLYRLTYPSDDVRKFLAFL